MKPKGRENNLYLENYSVQSTAPGELNLNGMPGSAASTIPVESENLPVELPPPFHNFFWPTDSENSGVILYYRRDNIRTPNQIFLGTSSTTGRFDLFHTIDIPEVGVKGAIILNRENSAIMVFPGQDNKDNLASVLVIR